MPFPSPGDIPDLGIEPGSPALQEDSLPSEPSWKPIYIYMYVCMYVCMYVYARHSQRHWLYDREHDKLHTFTIFMF